MPQETSSQQTLWKINVDIPLCLMCFAISLTGNVLTDFIVYRTCYVTLGYNETECAKLNSKDTNQTHTDLEEKVQAVATLFTMSSTVIQAIIPATLGMFLGPWSDKHGRKPLIVLPLIGYMIHLYIIVTLTFLPNASPIFIVLASLPMSFSGGFTAMLTGIFCYISDLVPVHNRALRIGILQGMLSFGLILGGLSSAPLLKATNYTVVFALAAFLLFIGAIYTIFLIPESVRNEGNESGGLFSMVDCNLVIDLWSTCFKQRSENRRLAIWLIIITLGLMLFKMDGTFQLDYLFAREKFHWTLQHQSIYSAISSCTGIIGSMLTIYIFSKVLNVSEVILALVSFISAGAVAFMKAFAQTNWQMYITIPVGMFEGMGSPMCRSLLSRMVPEQELGKVFAMAASLEAIMPLVSAPTYTYIYDKTLTTFTGAFYLLCAATEIVMIVLFCILFFVTRNFRTTSNIMPVKINNENEEEENE